MGEPAIVRERWDCMACFSLLGRLLEEHVNAQCCSGKSMMRRTSCSLLFPLPKVAYPSPDAPCEKLKEDSFV